MMAIIGWDIGGAHVKAARAEGGRLVAVIQRACAPHLGLANLEQAIRVTLAELGAGARHRVTMTAELSDAFESRAQGVVSIGAIASREIGGADILFYAGAQGFVTRTALAAHADAVASANWRVAATFVAQRHADALLVDIGSTTTDLLPIRDGAVATRGATDAERLAHGELAYAGFSRGAPQAYASRAPIEGRWTPLVNEAFASMADVRRIFGDLPEGDSRADLSPTADGRPKTIAAAIARLARLVGRDGADLTPTQAQALAHYLARAQMRAIEDQIALLASRDAFAPQAPFIGAGVGRRLVARLATGQGRDFLDLAALFPAPAELREAAADCAPAAALALVGD